jgi:LysR family transcriptional regulator, regulator of abg operon
MRHFDAVARHASLHGAARALGVAQSALSRSIRELEHDLGVPLLLRSARGVDLTAAGERFLIRARRVQTEIERGKQEAAQATGEQTGTVTVGLSSIAQQIVMPLMIRRFRRAWPGIQLVVIEAELGDLQKRLSEGGIDFCIGTPIPGRASAAIREDHLVALEQAIFCRSGHPAADAATPAELADCDWIELPETQREPFLDRSIIRVPSLFSAIGLMAQSEMLAVLPRLVLDLPGLGAQIDMVDIDEPLRALPLSIFARAGMPLTPAAQHLYDAATRIFDNLARDAAPSPEIRSYRKPRPVDQPATAL